MNILDDLKNYFGFLEPWMIQSFVIVFVFAVINFVQKRVLRKVHQKFKQTRNVWDDALIESIKAPLSMALWIIGITLAADVIYKETHTSIFELVEPLRRIGIIACLIWFAVSLAVNIENSYIEQHPGIDLTSAKAIGKLIRLALIITGVLITLQTMGISISGVLAFGGIGGIAMGFAAKDLLSNFFGGLMIYLDRPFEVGNWIRSPDQEIEGTVEEIGWRLTRIRTFEKRLLYIPNSVFTNIVVENPSRMSHRRIKETIGVRYDDIAVLPKILEETKTMLKDHKEIDHDQIIMVNFDNFGASSLDFFVYAYTVTTQWAKYHEVKQDVLFKIAGIIEKHGAEIAFPTSTVHVPGSIAIEGMAGS